MTKIRRIVSTILLIANIIALVKALTSEGKRTPRRKQSRKHAIQHHHYIDLPRKNLH